jgi:hypothetical protein
VTKVYLKRSSFPTVILSSPEFGMTHVWFRARNMGRSLARSQRSLRGQVRAAPVRLDEMAATRQFGPVYLMMVGLMSLKYLRLLGSHPRIIARWYPNTWKGTL